MQLLRRTKVRLSEDLRDRISAMNFDSLRLVIDYRRPRKPSSLGEPAKGFENNLCGNLIVRGIPAKGEENYGHVPIAAVHSLVFPNSAGYVDAAKKLAKAPDKLLQLLEEGFVDFAESNPQNLDVVEEFSKYFDFNGYFLSISR